MALQHDRSDWVGDASSIVSGGTNRSGHVLFSSKRGGSYVVDKRKRPSPPKNTILKAHEKLRRGGLDT